MTDGVGAALAAVNARLDDAHDARLLERGCGRAGRRRGRERPAGRPRRCVGANHACHAERVLMPAPLCIPLPSALDDRWGSFAALGAIAGHGVRTAEVTAGSVVAVIGLGLIGQMTAQLATAAGARVIGIDPDRARVELALEHGAVDGVVLGSDDAASVVLSRSEGEGADAVILTAATKDSGPVELAAELARDRAIVSVIGDVGLEVPRRPFYEKELQLRLSRSYGPGRYDDDYELRGHDYPIGYVRWTQRRLISHFLAEVEAGRIDLAPLVTHEFDFADATGAYAALDQPGRMGILLRYPAQAPEPVAKVALAVAPAPAVTGALRVGLVGPGLFARSTLLPLLQKLDVDVAGVVGSSGTRAVGVAKRTGAAFASSSARELIDDPAVGALVIATRHDSHAELAAAALRAGKAVFLEKPLAIDAAGLELVASQLKDGGRLLVDFNRGFAPGTERVRAHFAGRTDPLVVQCRVNAGALPPDHWLRDAGVGGGRLVGEGCHFVDLCSSLIERAVRSVTVAPLGTGPRTLADDSFVLTLGYEDGSLGVITYIATGSPRMPKERIEVLGAGRSAVIDDFRRVRLLRPSAPAARGARSVRPRTRATRPRCAASSRSATRGGEPPIPYQRLIETTQATLLASEALAKGSREPIAL